jgi:hypothetical protein
MHGTILHERHRRLRIKQLVVVILTLAIAVQVHPAYATPVAPVLLVNSTLQQCIEQVILADECHICRPVEGWKISQTGQCPAGYNITPRQTILDQDLPVNCVEYPKNEWAFCTWGRYPTMTPEFATVQQPTRFPSTPSITPPTPAITRYSFDYPFILCIGSILGFTIIGILLMRIRRKKILTGTRSK